jgi:hypothetical protein
VFLFLSITMPPSSLNNVSSSHNYKNFIASTVDL